MVVENDNNCMNLGSRI